MVGVGVSQGCPGAGCAQMGGPGAFAAIWEAMALIPHPRLRGGGADADPPWRPESSGLGVP